MPARRRPATARVTQPVEPGLRLHAEGDRYSTLLKERERLLRSIQTKKQKLERALEDSHEARRSVLERLEPFVQRHEATTAEIRLLFEELLAPGRLAASAAKQVARVRRIMAELGYLGMLDEALDPLDADPESAEPTRRDERPPYPASSDGEPESQDYARRDLGSAEQIGQGKDQGSLRAVFKRLVAASHPDRASNEADRERRTAAMKLATQAYEQGDLARLLELEAAWLQGQALPSAGSAEARCRELELLLRGLRAQGTELQRHLRAARGAASLTPESEPIQQALEDAQGDVEHLERVRQFITRFRDGKISLRQFIAGQLNVEDDLEAILVEVFGQSPARAANKQKRPKAQSKRRTKRAR